MPRKLAGSGRYYVDKITASTTWTAPSTLKGNTVWVTQCGGGGGGGAGSAGAGGGGGGGGQAKRREAITVNPGDAVVVTIAAAAASGVAGGTTTFGALLSTAGGAAGVSQNGGARGGDGASDGMWAEPNSGYSGQGGGSLAPGGAGSRVGTENTDGAIPGGGGGGGRLHASAPAGGIGARGEVTVEYFA